MKKIVTFVMGFLVTAATIMAASFISKATAQKDALAAVGGGTVVQAVLETADTPPQWSVDVLQKNYEYEVHLNAYTGKVLQIIKQIP
jgi:uncharacterized membrane protein YkoI